MKKRKIELEKKLREAERIKSVVPCRKVAESDSIIFQLLSVARKLCYNYRLRTPQTVPIQFFTPYNMTQ